MGLKVKMILQCLGMHVADATLKERGGQRARECSMTGSRKGKRWGVHVHPPLTLILITIKLPSRSLRQQPPDSSEAARNNSLQ